MLGVRSVIIILKMTENNKIRLQKYLAMAGIASRRKSEEYITRGLIKVNGIIADQLGTKVDPEKDKILFRGRPVNLETKHLYIIINKPKGIVTSCSQIGEIPITSLVKGIKERLYPVGRLDKDSTGLVILTNDGDFALKMMHPKFEHEKEYLVETIEPVTKEKIEKLSKGVRLGNQMTKPSQIKYITARKFQIILKEGINRQIRRMFAVVGAQVKSLHRIRIGNINLGELDFGKWRMLDNVPFLYPI